MSTFSSVLSLRDGISDTFGDGIPPKKRPANAPAVLMTLSMELLRSPAGDAVLCLTGVTELTGVVDLLGVGESTGADVFMGVVELTGMTELAVVGGLMRTVESTGAVELLGVAKETGVTELTGPVKLMGTVVSRPLNSKLCS